MCECAAGAIDCMPSPGVADLCCPTRKGCCDPTGNTIGEIPAETITQFELDGTVPVDTPSWVVPLLKKHQRAIALAVEKLAGHVCLARYVGGCCVKAEVCVEAPCCPTSCCSCLTCKRSGVDLSDIAECVCVDRISKVTTADGAAVGFNGNNNTAPLQIVAAGGCWTLFGAAGIVELCFELKPVSESWLAAVESIACSRVKSDHAPGCHAAGELQASSSDGQSFRYLTSTDYSDRGMLGDLFGDDLETECAQGSGVSFGGWGSAVRWVRFDECETVGP